MSFTQPAFQFSVRYKQYANPPGRTEAVAQSMLDLLRESGFECYFGALGGGVCTYGVVWSESTPISIEDRNRIESWLKDQAIECTVQLGEIEELDETDIMRDYCDREFEITNLTDAERKAAADRAREASAKIEALKKARRRS